MLVQVFLVVEKVIQLKVPRFINVVGSISIDEDEDEAEDDEEDDEEEDDEEEEDGELTVMMFGLLLNIGKDIAEISAAVVSTGTEKVSSTS